MNIVLVGFMGTGKSVVGRRVAQRLRVPFVDVDLLMERQAGQSIRQIFSSQGETGFRQLEHDMIGTLSQVNRSVIATGGGALLDSENRETLRHNGLLVCLTATVATLLERLKNDTSRPLLAGENLPDRLDRLMREREALYAECPIHVATDFKSADDVAADVIQKTASAWKAA